MSWVLFLVFRSKYKIKILQIELYTLRYQRIIFATLPGMCYTMSSANKDIHPAAELTSRRLGVGTCPIPGSVIWHFGAQILPSHMPHLMHAKWSQFVLDCMWCMWLYAFGLRFGWPSTIRDWRSERDATILSFLWVTSGATLNQSPKKTRKEVTKMKVDKSAQLHRVVSARIRRFLWRHSRMLVDVVFLIIRIALRLWGN